MLPDTTAEAASGSLPSAALRRHSATVPSGLNVWFGLAVLLGGAIALCWYGLSAAFGAWSRPEYSYGYLVPPIAAYLFWRRLPLALAQPVRGRGLGVAIALVAVLLAVLGALSHIADLSGYGFILALAGGLVALLGLPAGLRLWVPLVYLGFMLPLPQLIYLKLSAGMQLLSSEFGVALVRLVGIPVLLEGNIIDLGSYKLQVAEACSGLRYLFPLMSFGFLFAALYRGSAWHKVTLVASTVPITIAMNSVRIGVIGVLVAYYGTAQAEGFLHFFEGWVIFVACIALLFAETALLLTVGRLAGGGARGSIAERLDLTGGPRPDLSRVVATGGWARPLAAVLGLIVAGLLTLAAAEMGAASAVPPRTAFVQFPATIGDWRGPQTSLSPEIARVLAADDYLMATYVGPGGENEAVNFFVAYYTNQTDGRAVHSPQVCLPGDGWETSSFQTYTVPNTAGGVQVNRAIIQKGLSRALVYYWFEGRGRQVTNEYAAKWFILWDGIFHRRSDGALVRLVTPLPEGADERVADARLAGFLASIAPKLPAYVPN